MPSTSPGDFSIHLIKRPGSPFRDAGVIDPAFLIGLELHGIAVFRVRFDDGTRGRPAAEADDHDRCLALPFDEARPQEIAGFGIGSSTMARTGRWRGVKQSKGLLAAFHHAQIAEAIDHVWVGPGQADVVTSLPALTISQRLTDRR